MAANSLSQPCHDTRNISSSLLLSMFHGLEAFLRAFLQLPLHARMVLPDGVVQIGYLWVHEQSRALQILDQRPVAQVGKFPNQPFVKMFANLALAALVQQNEILPQFDMGRLVCQELAQHHYAGKNQHRQRAKQILISPQKSHRSFYETCPRAAMYFGSSSHVALRKEHAVRLGIEGADQVTSQPRLHSPESFGCTRYRTIASSQ